MEQVLCDVCLKILPKKGKKGNTLQMWQKPQKQGCFGRAVHLDICQKCVDALKLTKAGLVRILRSKIK